MALWDDLKSLWPLENNALGYTDPTNNGVNSGVSFNGTSAQFSAVDHIEMSDSSVCDVTTGDFSLSGWINALAMAPPDPSGGDRSRVIVKFDFAGGSEQGFGITLWHSDGGYPIPNTDLIQFHIANGGTVEPAAEIAIPGLGGWFHFAAVRTGTNIFLYINGSLASTATVTAALDLTTNTVLSIGAEPGGGALKDYFYGSLKQLAQWDRAITADEVSGIYNAQTLAGKTLPELIPQRQLPDNGEALSWIDMADNTMLYHLNSTSADDTSVNSNNAVVTSATAITGKTLYSGSTGFTDTMHFDGASTSVDSGVTPGTVGIDGSNPRTVMLWAKSDAWAANKVLFTIGTNSTRQDFSLLAASSDRIQFNGWSDDFFSTPPTVEGWNHYALVYDGGLAHDGRTVTLYFNGVYLNSDVMGADLNTSNAHNIKVGAPNYSWSNWNGDIQEFAIYDTNLSASAILNVYNAQKFNFVGTGSTDAIGLFGSVVHEASSSATAISLFGSAVHEISSFATALSLFGSVAHIGPEINPVTLPDITASLGPSVTFDATGIGITGSAIFAWSWESVPSGSTLTSASFGLPDNQVTSPLNMSGNVGLWHFDVETSSSLPVPPISSIGLKDSYGDGWHGNNFVNLSINGVPTLINITLAGGFGPDWFDYPVSAGDVISITYTAGSWPTECSYVLNNGAGGGGVDFFTSTAPPVTPHSYTVSSITTDKTPDTSGRGNDLVIGSATRVAGRVGAHAYNFDGTADWLSGPSTASLQIAGDISIAMWINADSYDQWEPMLEYAAGSELEEDNNLYTVGWANATGDIRFFWEYGAGVNQLVDFNTNLNTGQWYHLVAVRNTAEKTAHLYIDGELFESQIYANNPTGGESGSLIIGKDNLLPYYFDGTIDEVAIWDRTLSPMEVWGAYFMNSGSCASGSIGIGETFTATPDVVGTYDIGLVVVGEQTGPSEHLIGVISALIGPPLTVGTISYQAVEVAFSEGPEVPVGPSGTISYQSVEVAFSEAPEVPAGPSGTISYQSVEVAFSEVPEIPVGTSTFYGDILEVAWVFGSWTPEPDPPAPTGKKCGYLVNPDFSINTYGLRTLTCERIKAPGVEQVPFRLAHQTNLGLRRKGGSSGDSPPPENGIFYETTLEVAWVYTGG